MADSWRGRAKPSREQTVIRAGGFIPPPPLEKKWAVRAGSGSSGSGIDCGIPEWRGSGGLLPHPEEIQKNRFLFCTGGRARARALRRADKNTMNVQFRLRILAFVAAHFICTSSSLSSPHTHTHIAILSYLIQTRRAVKIKMLFAVGRMRVPFPSFLGREPIVARPLYSPK